MLGSNLLSLVHPKECKRCRLHHTRRCAVLPRGPDHARVALVGEGPGKEEDETGRPFVGPAGRKLAETSARIGLPLDLVLIDNVIRCRPPGDRDPLPDETAACLPWLHLYLSAPAPSIVVALGKYATAALLLRDPQEVKPGQLRGKWFRAAGREPRTGLPAAVPSLRAAPSGYPHDYLVFSTYHPAFICRRPYSPEALDFAADLRTLKNVALGFQLW